MDTERLKRNWAEVAAHGDQVPLFFYSTLFLAHPHLRDMFPLGMANQRDKLLAALGQVVSHVDDLDAVVPVLQQLGRDHRRFGVVRDHYPAVGEALLATLEHFSSEWTPELARDWAAAYELVAQVMVAAADAASEMPPWWHGTVTAIERRTAGIAVLTVRPHTPLPYLPGQSVAVEVPTRPRLWRWYTPATLPGPDGSFELHVRLVPGGQVSPALVQATQVGDVLHLGAPVGTDLVLDDGTRDLLLIAGGTGLAPFKAVLSQLAQQRSTRFAHLYWGGRHHRDLYDLVAMRRLCESHDGLRLVPCVSDEPAPGGDVAGGTAVDVALREADWRDHEVYICGSPEMVRATRDRVLAAGVPRAQVHLEAFGNQQETAT